MNEVKLIDKDDLQYPSQLAAIQDAPAFLYYKGSWDKDLFKNCLAVVGSRHMTTYGKRVTEQLVGELAAQGITIVSGFMYGIDATAHEAAVKVGGKTIAVMPCGIERIHPEHQKDLYKDILDKDGLIVSEYEGKQLAQKWTYPARNRIVAGLAQATLVVEAAKNSGTLITARLTKQFKRKLFAVPGPITSEVSMGCVQLIQQGAQAVASAEDILSFYRKERSTEEQPALFPIGSLEERILDVLKREAAEVDLLARTLHVPASELGTTLSLLELQGVIKQEQGRYYAN